MGLLNCILKDTRIIGLSFIQKDRRNKNTESFLISNIKKLHGYKKKGDNIMFIKVNENEYIYTMDDTEIIYEIDSMNEYGHIIDYFYTSCTNMQENINQAKQFCKRTNGYNYKVYRIK